jgi:putative GTP pyrophosphokinase
VTEPHSEFLDEYEEYVRSVLLPTRAELKKIFAEWREPSYWADDKTRTRLPSPSPVQRAFTRIKRPEAVVDKILRKPNSFPEGINAGSMHNMMDALAGRVIVYFLSNLPLIHRELTQSDRLEVCPFDPPIAYLSEDLANRLGLTDVGRGQKESGYASLHYVVRLTDSAVPREQRPWVEIQVRTLAEDIWGEIEHLLGYRTKRHTSFAVRRQFQILSSQLTAIDEHFALLYDELRRFQDEVSYEAGSLLNAENLPPVLNELSIGCAQFEINGLLKLLASRGIETVGALRAAASTRNIEIVRNTFRSVEGEEPRNFDVVAGIGAVGTSKDEKQIAAAVRTQIEFLKAWEKLRDEIA